MTDAWERRREVDYSPKLLDWSGITKLIDWTTLHSPAGGSADRDDDCCSAGWASDDGGPCELGRQCERFEDEEDRRAFAGFSFLRYGRDVLPLRGKETACSVHFSLQEWPPEAIKRFGILLSRANQLRSISFCVNIGDEEIMPLVFCGPFEEEHPLKTFSLRGGTAVDSVEGRLALSEEGMTCVGRYLEHSTSLRHLKLTNLILSGDALKLLANALRWIELEDIMLEEVSAGEEHLSTLLESLDTSELRHLSLVDCNVGRVVCGTLADILQDDDSALETLVLDNDIYENAGPTNRVDDECVDLLCRSLVSNTSLISISIGQNDAGVNGDAAAPVAEPVAVVPAEAAAPPAPEKKKKLTAEERIRKERPPPRIRIMESSQPDYTALRLEDVAITFRDQPVLKSATWGVQTGDRIGLVGANGAGKTTQDWAQTGMCGRSL